MCMFGQKILFDSILPLLVGLQKLKIPSNNFKDHLADNLIGYLNSTQKSQITSLNIGNNHILLNDLNKILTFILNHNYPIRNLGLSFQIFEANQFKQVIRLFENNKVIDTIDIRGCALSLDDMFELNQTIISNPKTPLRRIRVSLNKFSEE